MSRRNFFSSSGFKLGFPKRCGMETPEMKRLTFILVAMETRLVMSTAGIPFCSISFAIAAPQRVQEPQVDVMMTPLAPLFLISARISRAIFPATSGYVPVPAVV